MSTLPTSITERLEWLGSRIDAWTTAGPAIGLTPQTCQQLDDAIKAAQEAYDNAQKQRQVAKDATITQTAAVRDMTTLGSDAIRFIRAFADSRPTQAARDAVYAASSVPPPAPPAPQPAPEAPVDVVADPNADGTVTVRWKATGNSGVVYLVYRQLHGNTQWSQIGITGEKKLIDPTVPAGTVSVMYQLRAQRGVQVSGLSQVTQVRFGAGGAAGFSGNVGIAA